MELYLIGDCCFFGGDSNSINAEEIIRNIPEDFNRKEILMIPSNEQWGNIIEKICRDKCKKYNRYSIKKNTDFNVDKLKEYENGLPLDYYYRKIDKDIYNKYKNEKWFKDFCSQFIDYSDYEKRGIGFVIINQYSNEAVCGASSYTIYRSGIEIQIETKQEYRRKGLATMCGAKLILECLKRNIYPGWDADNKESLMLAEKLGYSLDKEYTTYLVSVNK